MINNGLTIIIAKNGHFECVNNGLTIFFTILIEGNLLVCLFVDFGKEVRVVLVSWAFFLSFDCELKFVNKL